MRFRFSAGKVAVLAASATAVVGLGGGIASAEPAAGSLTVTDSGSNPQTLPYTVTGSSTVWGVQLPAGASCPGDTASGGYHVNSFIVPASVDPAALTYQAGLPVSGSTTYYNLDDTTASPYQLENTAPAVPPAVTGQVQPLPQFEFFKDFRSPVNLASGNYLIGFACADTNGNTQALWDAPVTLTNTGTASTDSATFTSGAATATPEVPFAVVLPVGAAALLGGAVLLQRRRRKPSTTA